ncbi:hypothetical protein CEY09_30430 [Achromobacter marplatensis]|uniref:Uncharacterized protein n=1 Tax=Achromobacter marplatensis TaxID=470868 RepID=A0ABX9FY82_9BURK|nr:hypothetical protein CEY09_30430 [Achromobacter marplatensis]RBP10647.1 hypothetical protein DFP87_12510 [Achromobacter marplatensis]CAB3712924.1 hypothetical protein LMG26219_06031 [Achromobacter marplatensis]
MSAAKPKYFVASFHTCHISYRKLSAFEDRNPRMFALSNAAFQTWEEAHQFVVQKRKESVGRARKELRSAEKQLARALVMKKPEAPV